MEHAPSADAAPVGVLTGLLSQLPTATATVAMTKSATDVLVSGRTGSPPADMRLVITPSPPFPRVKQGACRSSARGASVRPRAEQAILRAERRAHDPSR